MISSTYSTEQESSKQNSEQLQVNPPYSNPEIAQYFQLGCEAQTNKDFLKAIEYYRKILELDPKNDDAFFNIGFSFDQEGNFKEAIKHYNKAIEINPHNDAAYYNLGSALHEQGNLNDAIKNYSKAVELNPLHESALINLGNAYSSQGKLEEAIRSFAKAAEINPEDSVIFNNMGRAYYKLRQYDNAVRSFSEAIKFNPEDFTALNNLGLAYYNQFNLQKAKENYLKAIGINADYPAAYNNCGRIFHDQKDYSQAIEYYSKALEKDAKFVQAYFNRANAFDDQGDCKRAILDYQKAIELDPQYDAAYYNLGTVYYNQGNYKEAIKNYTKVIEINPDDQEAYNDRGVIFYAQGNFKEAIKDFNTAIKLDPENFLYYYIRGQTFSQLEKQEEALKDLNKAHELSNINSLHLNWTEEKTNLLKESLVKDRLSLLSSLSQIEKVSNDTEALLSTLESKQVEVENESEKFGELKKSLKKTTTQVVDSLQNDNEDVQNLRDENAKLKKDLEMFIHFKREMEERLRKLESSNEKISETIQAAGVADLADVKLRFEALAKENEVLYQYCRTFYWTLLNYFEAYRVLTTNLVTTNQNYDIPAQNRFFEMGLKKTAALTKQIVKGLPLVGNAVQVLDSIIDPISNIMKRKKLVQKIDAITRILSMNNDPKLMVQGDISLTCAFTALNITEQKKVEIEQRSVNSQKASNEKKVLNPLLEKSKALKEYIFPSLKLKDSSSAELALQDVSLLLGFIYANCDQILESKEALHDQFTKILVERKWEKDIEG